MSQQVNLSQQSVLAASEDTITLQYTESGGPYTVYGTKSRRYYRYGGRSNEFEIDPIDLKQFMNMKRRGRPIFTIIRQPEAPKSDAVESGEKDTGAGEELPPMPELEDDPLKALRQPVEPSPQDSETEIEQEDEQPKPKGRPKKSRTSKQEAETPEDES